MKEYTRVQIIKHALKEYIKRPEATEKDIEREEKLLEYYTDRAEFLKKKYGIKKEGA